MQSENQGISGLVFNIQRHSTEDGPGNRTTVFLQGCPMRCPWCHNPEGLSSKPQLVWRHARCIGARRCVDVCPQHALVMKISALAIDHKLCDACGDCVEACPSTALEVIGKTWTVQEVVELVMRDRVFYEKSGGGVTLSGGEPAMQGEFCATLLRKFRREKIHIALDTCGGASWERLKPLVELSDLVLYDLKIMDEPRHKQLTGLALQIVLDNAREISNAGKPMWIRTPVIPGHTDGEENILQIAHFIRDHLPAVERFDLLTFNNMCAGKYEKLGLVYPFAGQELVASEHIERLARVAADAGLNNVRWSGITRRESQ